MWHLRLTPYVWSIHQALAWGAIVGMPCGVGIWLIGWSLGAGSALVGLLASAMLGAGISATLVAMAALLRNAVTGWFYRTQKLERLRAARWVMWELAVAGATTSVAVALIAFPVIRRLIGEPEVGLNLLLLAPLCAVVGAGYLPLVGSVRCASIARRQV